MIKTIKKDLNNSKKRIKFKNPYKFNNKKNENRLNRLKNINIKKKNINKFLY